MEPVKTPLNLIYTMESKVVSMGQRTGRQYIRGVGEKAEFVEADLGWWMTLDGSHEAIYMGMIQPWFKPGDKIRITFEKAK